MPYSLNTIDLISAICVGLNQALVGHPFDTVKVLLQTHSTKRPPLVWYRLPWRTYYRGVRYPLMTGIGFNGTVFPVYEAVRRQWGSPFWAGFVAGVMVTPFVAVSEGAKIIRQTSTTRQLTRKVVCRGMPSTFLRETSAMSTYFATYSYLHETHHIHPFWAGGLCGLAGWTVSYPVDVIRSRQIVSETPLGFMEAMHRGRLWVGFPACAVRAMVVNATNFAVYEAVRDRLETTPATTED